MARLTRKNIKVFADSASNNGVFGSLQAGNPTVSNDVETLQSLTAWNYGWNSATMTSEKLPPLEEIQGVTYVTTYQQAYIMQEGLPEWAATVTYYKGSLVKKVTTTGFQIYNSLTDNNTNNLLSDTANWKLVMDSDDLYAYDNAVVHLAGSETITGAKTFTHSIDTVWSNMTKGTAPASNTYNVMLWGSDNNSKAMGMVELGYLTDKQTKMTIGAFNGNTTDSADDGVYLELFNDNGVGYAKCPTPNDTTSTSSNKIATTGWVNSVGNNVVHINNDEIITGQKTLQNSMLIFKTTGAAYNETPSNNLYGGLSWNDKNNTQIASIYTAMYSNGGGLVGLNLKNKSGNTEILSLRYDSYDNFYTQAPASDVANSIVTTVNKSKSATGYFQLGNGLIVQWGKSTATSTTGTVTLPKAFTSTNYAVVINDVMATVPSSQGSNANLVGWGVVSTRTTTNFTAFLCNYENSSWWRCGWDGRTFTWIAIGY